ncbi:site-specific integrase [uncultured Fibrobacter sp.]|uniref:site-specific integrase n=1 Tax=uncultured Fibrobacter sp. TaxID=261512 RepID=UPI002623F0ED|nr:site-specific integrase [uncultured Fibrobacter sp.]
MLFFDEAQRYLEQDKENLAPLTARTYYWNLKKIQYFRPDLDCSEINAQLIRDFRQHLQELGNKPNTVIKALSVLRNFTQKMLADGLISENPFEKLRVGRAYTQRGFLTTNELKKLYLNFQDRRRFLTETEQDVMRVFLFSCFTGLRYGDLRSLDASEIFDWKIRKQMHKTGDPVYIPIPLQARLLLPEKMEAGRVFRVVENSHFNRTLRSAAKKLGYHKHIHCHLARHTFATTCITLGISLPATSKLLGHRTVETTLIYAKFVDPFLDKEMKKFKRLG